MVVGERFAGGRGDGEDFHAGLAGAGAAADQVERHLGDAGGGEAQGDGGPPRDLVRVVA